MCVISSSVVHQEVTDSEIEQILAEKEQSRALDMVFGSTDTDADADTDDIEDEEEENGTVNEQLFTAMIDSLKSNFDMQFEWNIMVVECSAHSLQLGINDSLKQLPKAHQNVIELCRQAAKFLRKKSTKHELNENNIHYNLPRMDVKTRWCYTFLMVCS